MSITPSVQDSSTEEKPKKAPRKKPQVEIPPADHTGVVEGDFPKPITLFPTTELANADRLIYHFGDFIRYCYPWKDWLIWSGTHWREDKNGEINRLAERVTRSILLEANSKYSTNDQSQALARWFLETATARKIRAFIELAQSKVPIMPEELDSHPFLLNARNGTINLENGDLLPHDPQHNLTKRIDIDYDPEARCPLWDKFLLGIMGGNANLTSYLQRAIGYALTGDVREQVMFVMHGHGSNGKSTFINTINALLGEYAQQAPTETLMAKQNKGIPNDIARMRGARFMAAVETEQGRSLSEVLVKQLTGGDTITARFLNKEFFEFKPTHKIFLATNHLPKVRGTDHAIWRRLPLIPFEVTYWNPDKGETGPPELERDNSLGDKLKAELPGILAWAVRGCLDWLDNGLGWPAEVTAATDEYRSNQDVLAAFIDEECYLHEGTSVRMDKLYPAYVKWCQGNGEHAMKKRDFGERLKERGILPSTGAGNAAIRLGINLVVQPTPVAMFQNEDEE